MNLTVFQGLALQLSRLLVVGHARERWWPWCCVWESCTHPMGLILQESHGGHWQYVLCLTRSRYETISLMWVCICSRCSKMMWKLTVYSKKQIRKKGIFSILLQKDWGLHVQMHLNDLWKWKKKINFRKITIRLSAKNQWNNEVFFLLSLKSSN